MSRWTHAVCLSCWNRANPERPAAQVLPEPGTSERCCRCDAVTTAGIYVRGNPDDYACGGQGGVHEEAT